VHAQAGVAIYWKTIMKVVIRAFFRTLRLVIGPFILLWEMITRPKGVSRPAQAQGKVDRECGMLALYEFKTCPFCIKVRQEMRRLSLPIERRDAQHPGSAREELVRGGGQAKVPCLRVSDKAGNSKWLYESDEIIAYLRGRFAPQ
jgi:glutaredoxin